MTNYPIKGKIVEKRCWHKKLREYQTKEEIDKCNKLMLSRKNDIIIKEIREVETIETDENGYAIKTKKIEVKPINITKQINETARKLKIDNNAKMLEILEHIGETEVK